MLVVFTLLFALALYAALHWRSRHVKPSQIRSRMKASSPATHADDPELGDVMAVSWEGENGKWRD